MSLRAVEEQNAIIAQTKLVVPGVEGRRVFRVLPEEAQIERDGVLRLPLDYILVTFGSLFPQEEDPSLEGAAQQPNIMPIIWECWSSRSADAASEMAGDVRQNMVGFLPSENNATEIKLRGGGLFNRRDSAGRPVRWMEQVTGVTTINMSIDVP